MLRLTPAIRRLCAVRLQHGTNAPSGSSGIEHANKFAQTGRQHQLKEEDYKCAEYWHFNQMSFYDTEEKMQSFRVPQPTNQKPDVEPKFK